ncbi:hypothetical protein P7K49_036066 [Saguinus oedipus]|uniref:Cation efflux protein transmembrane domain-containing protein n=1 Tax=Saguinus oedipus TaxID=9490 RepID=A0ABQ9TPE5_SAGOE|nr:hypothetical protein P7K49_036066 [Saguinus oedipus]
MEFALQGAFGHILEGVQVHRSEHTPQQPRPLSMSQQDTGDPEGPQTRGVWVNPTFARGGGLAPLCTVLSQKQRHRLMTTGQIRPKREGGERRKGAAGGRARATLACGDWLGSASRNKKRRSRASQTAQEAGTGPRGSAPRPHLWLRAGGLCFPGCARWAVIRARRAWLLFKLVLTVAFFVAELVSGYLGNSIARLSAGYIAQRPTGGFHATYGYARAEVVGALSNAIFLTGLCCTIFLEAVLRLARPERIDDPELVLIVGALGLLVNVVGLLIFQDCAAWFSCCRQGRGRRLQQRQQLAEDSAPGAFRGLQGPEDLRRASAPTAPGLDSAVTLRGTSAKRKQEKGATMFSNVAGAFRLHPLDRLALPSSSHPK